MRVRHVVERSGEPEGTGSRWSGGIVGERNERAVVSEWSGGAMVERNGDREGLVRVRSEGRTRAALGKQFLPYVHYVPSGSSLSPT